MQIQTLVFNPFSENTYIIYDETNESVIIDPGCYSEDEEKKITDFLSRKKLKPVKIINTHCHIDHILGVDFLKQKFKIKFFANKNDDYLLQNAVQAAEMYGLNLQKAPVIDENLTKKNNIEFGNSQLKILEVPGHTPGHLAFYSDTDKFILTGDVIFKDSIGRTDLPGGDLDILLDSIRTKIFSFDDEFTIYPGHGPTTGIGIEKKDNPFL